MEDNKSKVTEPAADAVNIATTAVKLEDIQPQEPLPTANEGPVNGATSPRRAFPPKVVKTKINKVSFALTMDIMDIAECLTSIRTATAVPFVFDSHESLLKLLRPVEQAFYRLQKSEEELLKIIDDMPKKKNQTLEIGRIQEVQVFDDLYYEDKEFENIYKLMFFAKAIDAHNIELKLGARKV